MSTALSAAAVAAMRRHSSTRLTGSTPVLGSSSSTSRGSCRIARTNPSFCRMPPDRSQPRRSRAAVSPARWSSSSERRRTRDADMRNDWPTNAMFSATLRLFHTPEVDG